MVFRQRTGAMAICAYVFVYSLFCCVCIFTGDIRFQSGGYNPATNKLQVYFGVCGIFFAYVGLNGMMENYAKYVQIFNYYQFAKLLVFLIVFVFDMTTLLKCDTWVASLESQTQHNPSIDGLSRMGLCPVARLSYLVGFVLDFSMNAYFTYVVADFARKLAMGPAFIISFPDASFDHDSRHLTFFDPKMGEPHEHLDPPSGKASEAHGMGYGATH